MATLQNVGQEICQRGRCQRIPTEAKCPIRGTPPRGTDSNCWPARVTLIRHPPVQHGHVLTGLVAVFSLGAAAQWLAWRLKVPSILMLLVVGFVAGPVSGLLDPEALLGPVTFPLVSLGAAVILFEGGLTVRLSDLRRVATPIRRLVTIGLVVTWAGATIAASLFLPIRFELAALLGAILVVTGPTVIGPLLRQAKPRAPLGSILKLEGILSDPIGAVLAVLVFQAIEAGQVESAVGVVAAGVLKAALFASGIGLGAAWLYTRLRATGWLPEFLENATLLPLVLSIYLLSNWLQHESGLLAVTVMGIALASQTKVNIQASLDFTEHTRTMLISVLFVTLTARLEIADLVEVPLGAIGFVAFVIFVLRPLAVALALLGSELSGRERLFLALVAPRGIVAAAVSSVFALRLVDAGYEMASLLMPTTFLVIAATVVVYGLGARPLVRALKLRQSSPNGILVLGANPIARALAEALQREGVRALLVDSDRSKVARAKTMGLDAVHGHLLSRDVFHRLDLDAIGHFLALTSNDDTNTLAAAHCRDVYGLDHVYQVQASDPRGAPRKGYAAELAGTPFANGKTYDELSEHVYRGADGEVTPVNEAFSFDDYVEARGARTIPLFVLSDTTGLRPVTSDADPPEPGDRLIALTRPESNAAPGGSMRSPRKNS